MNKRLAEQAQVALTAPGFETEPGYCLRFVRQVVQKCAGENAWPVPRGLDAKQAAQWLRIHRPDEIASGPGQIGSILFYVGPGHGPHGHVVIRIPGNRVAENSTVHGGKPGRDGRGIRSLAALGAVAMRWELPDA